MEYTLALVKPDGFAANAEIQQLAELNGFTIIASRQLKLSQRQAEEFYGEHKERAFFPGLVEFMSSDPIMALVLAKADAIRAWRQLMGPTDVFEARVKAPKSMRALYGSDGTRNGTHGSDSPASAAREIRFFFPRLQLSAAGCGAAAAQEYIAAQLQPALVSGLTALAKAKPSSRPDEALLFLASWLLEHKQPRVEVPPELQAQLDAVKATAAAAAAASAAAAAPQQPPAPRSCSSASGRGSAPGELPAAVAGGGVACCVDQQEAATKVQAAFRGHQARKQVAGMRAAVADAS